MVLVSTYKHASSAFVFASTSSDHVYLDCETWGIKSIDIFIPHPRSDLFISQALKLF